MAIWWSLLPTQEEIIDRQKDAKFLNTVRSLETQILARYGVPNQTGNLTTSIYTYHNVTVTNWELKNNRTLVVLNFSVTNLYRIRRFGLVVNEYYGPSSNNTINAYIQEEAWFLNISSLRNLD
jgi:hypothetical protein